MVQFLNQETRLTTTIFELCEHEWAEENEQGQWVNYWGVKQFKRSQLF